jgi:hypothetical protein
MQGDDMPRADKQKRISALFSADWHLTEDQPEAWVSDYQKAQWEAVSFCVEQSFRLQVPLFIAGDLFHHWKPSPFLIHRTLRYLRKAFEVYIIPGQHDLAGHNLEEYARTGIGVLLEAGGNIKVAVKRMEHSFRGTLVPWGEEIPERDNAYFLTIHQMLWAGKAPYPGADPEGEAKRFMKKHRWPLIVAGDNHQTTLVEYEGRKLLIPGSLMRMTAAQIDHKPAIWGLTQDGDLVPYYIPQTGEITRAHLVREKEHNTRIEAFAKRLQGSLEVGLSFKENLTQFIAENRVSRAVEKEIWSAVEGE